MFFFERVPTSLNKNTFLSGSDMIAYKMAMHDNIPINLYQIGSATLLNSFIED